MTGWAVRGIGMALLNVLVRLLLGAAVSQWPLSGSQLRWVAYAIVLLVVVIWAGIDGIRDRRKNPDPDNGADLTMIWLKAAVVGGLLAGLLSWIAGFFVDFSLGQNSLFFELTSGAAFTVLTIFIAATIAVFVGHFIVNREAKRKLVSSDAQHAHDRELINAGNSRQDRRGRQDTASGNEAGWTSEHGDADTEVFSAVDADGRPRLTKNENDSNGPSTTRANKHGAADGS